MKQRVHMICNAHLDPIWLWNWEEGAAQAVSTFRTAADFCEEFDGFVFNHNEAMLYQWVEEYEPALFARIQRLVQEGRWNILGGWYLQPDCTMLSGESFLRQIEEGRRYFREKFGKTPTTAVNFDSFGHTRGLVQILRKTGYDSYVFMRPYECKEDFLWRGFDGSEISAHPTGGSYHSYKNQAASKLESFLQEYGERPEVMFLWGIGDHGGGPSREDYRELKAFMERHSDRVYEEDACEDYFAGQDRSALPVVETSLGPAMVGCYTSMVRVKQGNRRVENRLRMAERMLLHAGLPRDEATWRSAEKALMLSQFHDVLPGTMIKKAEEDTLKRQGYAEEICNQLIAKAFFRLCEGQKPGTATCVPLLVYNPLPYAVEQEIELEFQLEDQNRELDWWNDVRVKDAAGHILPSQLEKEDCTFSFDWRKKVVFRARLAPLSVNRFDGELELVQGYVRIAPHEETDTHICIRGDRCSAAFNKATGLMDSFVVDGVEQLAAPSGQIKAYWDNEDPWAMWAKGFGSEVGEFCLLSAEDANRFNGNPEETRANLRVIENGPVRAKLQAIFGYEKSMAVVTYTVNKLGGTVDVHVKFLSATANRLYKMLWNPVATGTFVGQTAFGREPLHTDGGEATFHTWCGVMSRETTAPEGFFVVNTGTYGGSFDEGQIRITLLRTPVYSAHPFGDRPLTPKDRTLDRIDFGERELDFRLTTVAPDLQGELLNLPAYALCFFPSGTGESRGELLHLDTESVLLSTVKAHGDGMLLRLYNALERENQAALTVAGQTYSLTFAPFEVKGLVWDRNGLHETDLLGDPT